MKWIFLLIITFNDGRVAVIERETESAEACAQVQAKAERTFMESHLSNETMKVKTMCVLGGEEEVQYSM